MNQILKIQEPDSVATIKISFNVKTTFRVVMD